jgi:predicted RNA binding protein YcfA (HicA-like mRNA interferase family)
VRTYSAREVLAALQRAGFERVSRRGSHVKLRNAAGRTVIVPDHREIARGTMRSILRQADLTPGEFEKHV